MITLKKTSYLNTLQDIIKLSTPLILSQMLRLLTSVIATIMVAKLGVNPLAAIGLGYTFYMAVLLFCIGLIFSVGIIVGHAYGASDYQKLELGVANGLWLAVFLSIPVILLLYFGSYFFLFFHQDAVIVALTRAFLHGLAWGVVPILAGAGLQQLLLAISRTRVLNFFAMSSVLLNFFFCYVLIFGHFGFPRLGVAGAGVSISISAWINFFIMLIYVSWSPFVRKFRVIKAFFTYDLSLVSKLFNLGWPIGLTFTVEQLAFFVLVTFIGMLSTEALAAYQIVDELLLVALMIPIAVSQATTILVSRHLGKGTADLIRQTTTIATIFALLLIFCFSLMFWLMPHTLTSWFMSSKRATDSQIFYFSAAMLAFTGFIQLGDAIRMVLSGALRGIRDVRVPLMISMIAFWGVDIPLAVMVGLWFKWGAIAVWGIDVAGVGLATFLLWLRFIWQIRRNDNQLIKQPRGKLS